MVDNLWWKTTFGGKESWVKNNLWWKTISSQRRHLVLTPPLDSAIRNELKQELLSAVSTRNRICHRRKMYGALCMHICANWHKPVSVLVGCCSGSQLAMPLLATIIIFSVFSVVYFSHRICPRIKCPRRC